MRASAPAARRALAGRVLLRDTNGSALLARRDCAAACRRDAAIGVASAVGRACGLRISRAKRLLACSSGSAGRVCASHVPCARGRAEGEGGLRGNCCAGGADAGGVRAISCLALARRHRSRCGLRATDVSGCGPHASGRGVEVVAPGDELHDRALVAPAEAAVDTLVHEAVFDELAHQRRQVNPSPLERTIPDRGDIILA